MSTRDELNRVARDVFGRERPRPEQLEAIEHVTAGRDLLVVLPTGAGPAAVHQVPAVLSEGQTVVVSPLIARQPDQRAGLAGTDAPEAVTVDPDQRRRTTTDEASDQRRRTTTDEAWKAVREDDLLQAADRPGDEVA